MTVHLYSQNTSEPIVQFPLSSHNVVVLTRSPWEYFQLLF